MATHGSSAHVPIGRAAFASKPTCGLAPQRRVAIGPLTFSSDFDGGNVGNIERSSCEDGVGEYIIDIAPDCCGTPFENGYRTWFYFGVELADAANAAVTARERSGETIAPQAVEAGAESAARGNGSLGYVQSLTESSALPLPCARHVSNDDGLRTSLSDLDAASASAEGDREDDIFSGEDDLFLDGRKNAPHRQKMHSDQPLDCGTGSWHQGNVEPNIGSQVSIAASLPYCPASQELAPAPEKEVTVQLVLRLMNNQCKLYKQGTRPWFRHIPQEPRWRRLVDSSATNFCYEWGGEPAEGGSGLTLRWRHRLVCNGGTSYFAFCAPFGYTETQALVDILERSFANPRADAAIASRAYARAPGIDADSSMDSDEPSTSSQMEVDETHRHRVADSEGFAMCDAPSEGAAAAGDAEQLRCLSDAIQEDWVPRAGHGIYFHRQELHRSLEGRAVDLLTITAAPDAASGCSDNGAEALLDEPPQQLQLSRRPARLFPDKPIVFVSARVHPGETPAQFTFFGLIRFLLSDDPRAVELRKNFTFKLVPILNPDGVAKGHYRTNSRGLNLNRYYDIATPEEHEGVWAAKQILMHWADQGRLLFYIDLHAHATKRGCFFLANKLSGMGQAWNTGFARLLQVNSPHFDLDGSDFSEAKPGQQGADGLGKDGSGRVSIYQSCKLCHAYTLECNYHAGRFTKPISAAAGLPTCYESPNTMIRTDAIVAYTPGIWAQVGEAVCISILDLYGHNCYSRPSASKYGSVARLLSSCPSLRARNGCRGGSDVMPCFHGGVSFNAVSDREKACHRPGCCWRARERAAPMARGVGTSNRVSASCGPHSSSEGRQAGAATRPNSTLVRPPPARRPEVGRETATGRAHAAERESRAASPSVVQAAGAVVRRRARPEKTPVKSASLPRRRAADSDAERGRAAPSVGSASGRASR